MVKNPFEAAACFKSAATMYKKVDNKRAVAPLEKTVEIFASISKFSGACKAAMECGELLEKDVGDIEGAIAMYEKAADYAQMDGQAQSSENKANLKIASLLAQTEKFGRAVEIFEQIAEGYVLTVLVWA
jgi:tetratricopeptide (TPR) repeat protein